MARKIAIFSDRDGVINKEVGNLHKIEDIEILPGVIEAIKIFNKMNFPFIVITNQPVVARGLISEKGVKKINSGISAFVKKNGARIDRFYFCPHHPQANLDKYRIICNCRKPAVGLFEKAASDYKINIRRSYVIGDSFRDIIAGKTLKCTTIFVNSGSGDLRGEKPDFIFDNLYQAALFIKKREGFK